MKNKIFIQSKINLVKARIQQIKESDLFSESERETLIEYNESELLYFEEELAKITEVNNPEIL